MAMVMSFNSPAEIYRSYLRHLRLIPDPHVWATLQPRFRSLLQTQLARKGPAVNPASEGESSKTAASRDLRRSRDLKRAKKELNKLRAAVACHPHAYARLLEEAYGQRGAVRWEIISRITSSSSQTSSQLGTVERRQIPAPLLPLKPTAVELQPTAQRARTTYPATAARKADRDAWRRDWRMVKVPLVLPSIHGGQDGGSIELLGRIGTGWEDKGVVDSLRILAGFEGSGIPQPNPPRRAAAAGNLASIPAKRAEGPLPTMGNLSPTLARIFPRNPDHAKGTELPPYPLPSPGSTRQNPRTWTPPRKLRPRLVRRLYKRLWESLSWVRPSVPLSGPRSSEHPDAAKLVGSNHVAGRWMKCSWEDMRAWERGETLSTSPGNRKGKGKAGGSVLSGQWSVASEEETRFLMSE